MIKTPVRTLGVLGGMGPAATAEFLLIMARMAPAQRDQEHPKIILLSDPGIPDRIQALIGQGEDPSSRLKQGLDQLVSWGADLLAVPCNTAHIFIDSFCEDLPCPLIHIVEATLGEARRRSPRGAWLLATRGTCRSGLYSGWAKEWGYDLRCVTEEVQVKVSEVIRLVKANRLDEAAALLGRVLEPLWTNCDLPVILACTELPLAYDATGLQAEKAVSSLEALASACLCELYGDLGDGRGI